MPLNYSIAMLGKPREKNDPHKAYAKAQINGEMSLKELSKEVAGKSTVHSADVYAVLIATTESMLAALKAGKQVDFGELGKFRLQINSKGAITAEDFSADNITGVTIQYVPGDDLKTIFQGLQFNLVPSRYAQAAMLRAQKKGETTVDLSKPGEDEEEAA